MYARSNEIKIDENSNFSPMYPYGISKLSSHLLVNEYRKKFNIKCSSGIFFNHESPYRNEKFLSKKVSNFVKKILLGEDLKINLNNLNIYRDISHAEDFMKGVKIIVENKVNEDFIFSSGELISMKKFVNLFFEMFNLNFEDYLIYSEENNETYKIYGDNSKLKSLGWNPEFRIEDLVRQMVEIS
jgi:GDPmannose 4,6-dehydratase